MNYSNLIGRLTKDPELHTSSQGNPNLHFTLAVPRRYGGPKQEQKTDFIPCVIWKGGAKVIADRCRKGSHIGISGPIQSRVYDPGNGSPKKYIVEVNVKSFDLYLDGTAKKETYTVEPSTTNADGQKLVSSAPASEDEINIF